MTVTVTVTVDFIVRTRSVICVGFTFALAASLEIVSADSPQRSDERQWVALTALVSNPERFNGQRLVTFGYFLVDHEQSALCPHRRMASTADCLFVTMGTAPELNKLNGRAIMIEGEFNRREAESASFYSGSLSAVRARSVPEVRDFSDR